MGNSPRNSAFGSAVGLSLISCSRGTVHTREIVLRGEGAMVPEAGVSAPAHRGSGCQAGG